MTTGIWCKSEWHMSGFEVGLWIRVSSWICTCFDRQHIFKSRDILLYLSGPVACLNAMTPEASQTSGVRWAACIPVRCGTTVYDPLQQQRAKKGALTTTEKCRVVVPAWPRASWARHASSCRLGRGGLEGFLSHRWRWQHCLSSTRQSKAREEQWHSKNDSQYAQKKRGCIWCSICRKIVSSWDHQVILRSGNVQYYSKIWTHFYQWMGKRVETFDRYHVSDVLNELHCALIQVP